ncbi:SDR family NAD(P)-dependent oxidoreductase [Microbacterium sp.]|uniref:SDR family NAD(P)-dependent oxidoreductase n=1 Tax=Microbacterium sp. TaxID=51671 RepID=UPI003F9DC395
MDLGLHGARVVVTGSSSGIGWQTVRAFIEEGADVIGVDRTLPRDASELGADAEFAALVVDLVVDEAPAAVAAAVAERWGEFDVLVNCAGVAPTRASAVGVDEAGWAHTLAANLLAPVRLVSALAPMLADDIGVVVNIASTSARAPEPAMVDYAASKAALVAYTNAIAQELGPGGIRAVVVSPGPTRTELWDAPGGFVDAIANGYGMSREAAVDHHIRNIRRIPLGRPGDAREIADSIVFLASRRSRFTTGSALAVHGGMATHPA